VGAALGRNPFPILVPCHRVLSAGGALTGFAFGLAWKEALLAFEAAFAGRPPA
jgi:O-6-methylguanine DNA methyltransferase